MIYFEDPSKSLKKMEQLNSDRTIGDVKEMLDEELFEGFMNLFNNSPIGYKEYLLNLPEDTIKNIGELRKKTTDLMRLDKVFLKAGKDVFHERSFNEKSGIFYRELEERFKLKKDIYQPLPEYLFVHILKFSTPPLENLRFEEDQSLEIVVPDKDDKSKPGQEETIFPNQEAIDFVNRVWEDSKNDLEKN